MKLKLANSLTAGIARLNNFLSYYQWLFTTKPDEIVDNEYIDYGIGGNNGLILNTTMATFDGTAYLQGEVGQFNGYSINDYKGTSIPSIDYVNDRINVTIGELEWIELVSQSWETFRLYFQESSGVAIWSTNGFELSNIFIIYDIENIPDTGNYIVRDLFEGADIDLTKWVITNPDPTKLTFTQNNTLKVFNTGIGTVSFLANNIKSTDSINDGVIKFSVNVATGGGSSIFGVYVDNSNRVTFFPDSTGKITVYVVQAGVTRMQILLDDRITTGNFKVVITPANVISVWQWLGAWVQIGTDQPYDIGANKVFYASINATTTTQNYISIDDFFITNSDFNTLNP